MKKKVILQINPVANVGSTGKDAEGIGKAAIEMGWDSWIAYGKKCRPSASHLLRIGTDIDYKLHAFFSRLTDGVGLYSKSATKKFLKKVDEIQPDLVILHNIHGYYVNYPMLFDYLKSHKIPVIYSLHDCWAFTGHCCYFTTANCERWKTGCHSCPQLNTYPKSWFVDNSKRNYELKKQLCGSLSQMIVVGVSDWLCNLTRESFLGKYPVIRIYNGVNTSVFKYRDAKQNLWPGKKVIMGCASRWGERKGVNDYIRLSKILPSDYLILMIGRFDDHEFKKSLPSNIISIDRTDNPEELAEYYSRADVAICLSYMETMGLTPVEAMACGTPVVVYGATALPELVTPQTGLVAEFGNEHAVLDAINSILSKPKDYYSDNCRKRATECFDEIAQFKQYIELFNKFPLSNGSVESNK